MAIAPTNSASGPSWEAGLWVILWRFSLPGGRVEGYRSLASWLYLQWQQLIKPDQIDYMFLSWNKQKEHHLLCQPKQQKLFGHIIHSMYCQPCTEQAWMVSVWQTAPSNGSTVHWQQICHGSLQCTRFLASFPGLPLSSFWLLPVSTTVSLTVLYTTTNWPNEKAL